MKKGKRYLGLLLSLLLLTGQAAFPVAAEDDAMTVTAQNIFASQQGYPLTDGGTVWASAGKLYFTLSDAVDPSTLDGNVTLASAVGDVPCGADLYRDDQTIAVTFGRLTPGEAYTLTLGSNIKSADGTKNLTATTVNFTAGKDVIYQQGISGWTKT